MCDLYEKLLTETNEKISGQTFNVGYQNMSVMDIALLVKKIVAKATPNEAKISIENNTSNDIRSYHIN